jgi:hypothetical protein
VRKLLPRLLAIPLLVSPAASALGGETPITPPKIDVEKLVRDSWGGLYAAGKKAGYLHMVVAIAKRGEERVLCVKSEAVMRMQYMGLTVSATGKSLHEYSVKTGKLLLLHSVTKMGAQTITDVRITPDGENFKQVYVIAGKEHVTRIPRYEHTIHSAFAPEVMVMRKGAKVGDTFSVKSLKPDSGGAVRAVSTIVAKNRVNIRGVPVEVFTVQTKLYSIPKPGEKKPEKPLPLAVNLTKIDAGGRTIEGTILHPFTYRVESREVAKRMDQVSDIMSVAGVRLNTSVKIPRGAKRAVLEVSGWPKNSVSNSDLQRFKKQGEDSYELTLTAGSKPGPSKPLTPDEKHTLKEYLKATKFLQSDDDRIKKLAAETVGEEKDPYRAACLLNTWVFRNVRKVFTPMMSNALDTLKSRRGDCGEHAALFVALCRAAGIPAREVAGLAHTTTLAGDVLGGHAWAEVYAGGRWIAMDPTMNQKVADALHIKVAEGGMSASDGLIRLGGLMGNLKVKVRSVE